MSEKAFTGFIFKNLIFFRQIDEKDFFDRGQKVDTMTKSLHFLTFKKASEINWKNGKML
jgi:hypothetical protein